MGCHLLKICLRVLALECSQESISINLRPGVLRQSNVNELDVGAMLGHHRAMLTSAVRLCTNSLFTLAFLKEEQNRGNRTFPPCHNRHHQTETARKWSFQGKIVRVRALRDLGRASRARKLRSDGLTKRPQNTEIKFNLWLMILAYGVWCISALFCLCIQGVKWTRGSFNAACSFN